MSLHELRFAQVEGQAFRERLDAAEARAHGADEARVELARVQSELAMMQQSQARQRANGGINGKGNGNDGDVADGSHIPYKDHMLTRIMQDSIGGTAKTLMFVNVSPDPANGAETRTSLEFARKARQVRQGT